MKHFRFIAFVTALIAIAVISVNFSFRQDNFISVVGKAVYNTREYPTQRVKVYVTEDNKTYQTFYCDDKGRFETKVKLNHNYMFHFSMDYHATSKVLVDTHVPDKVSEGSVGGLFNFDCEMFERMDGLNLSILNNPLVKIKYDPEKKDFKYDKEYTERILFNLEGFREQLAEMKQRRKDVLKDGTVQGTAEKVEEKPVEKAERKPIVFEEPKPKRTESKYGHRNIMDPDPEEEEPVAQVEESQVEENEQKEEKTEEKTAVAVKETPSEKLSEEELKLEEAIDESEFVSLNVIPKRVEIKPAEQQQKPAKNDAMVAMKVKMQEKVESKRMQEEKRIRKEVTSLNTRAARQREMYLANKRIQNERLQSLIKTVALAELYYKMDYYAKHPVNHDHFIPTVVKRESEGFWKDQEEITVRYPGSTVVLKKVTFLFGISFYYRNEEEIDEQLYCSSVSDLTTDKYNCL